MALLPHARRLRASLAAERPRYSLSLTIAARQPWPAIRELTADQRALARCRALPALPKTGWRARMRDFAGALLCALGPSNESTAHQPVAPAHVPGEA